MLTALPKWLKEILLTLKIKKLKPPAGRRHQII